MHLYCMFALAYEIHCHTTLAPSHCSHVFVFKPLNSGSSPANRFERRPDGEEAEADICVCVCAQNNIRREKVYDARGSRKFFDFCRKMFCIRKLLSLRFFCTKMLCMHIRCFVFYYVCVCVCVCACVTVPIRWHLHPVRSPLVKGKPLNCKW